MDILNKISILLKEQHKTQKELCEYLGIGKQAFTNWKSGATTSYQKKLPQIADFFNVSIDYLLGKETIISQPNNLNDLYIAVSLEEKAELEELIANYRACDNAGKHKIIEASRIEADRFRQLRKNS